jgi:hypothetical protein
MLLDLASPVVAQRQVNSVNKLKGPSASSLRAEGATETPLSEAGVTAPPFQSACYPDAPPELISQVRAAAQSYVRNGDITGQNIQIVFFAIAHAISVDALDVEFEKKDLINQIEISRLSQAIERTDKQIGASARADGSTSAAEKPGFVELLGFAIEHGAVQQEVNGTTLTLSTSPYALAVAAQEDIAAQGDTATTYKKYGYLSRLGLSANFNITNQDDPLGSARRSQLAEWNARLRLTGDVTMRSQAAEDIWNRLSRQFAAPTLVLGRVTADLFNSVELEAKRREIVNRFQVLASSSDLTNVRNDTARTEQQKIDEIAQRLLCEARIHLFDQVRTGAFKISDRMKKEMINQTLPALAAAIKAKEEAITTFENQLKDLSFKPLLTFAYTNKREADGSDYSVLKLLFQKKTREGVTFIANAGFSVYHNPDGQMNQEQIRDYAAALSIEGNAVRSPFLNKELDESQITFSLTGRYQRLLENRGVINKKADIAVAQFKLEIPMFSGATLPFSITYANATELIKEDHVRANFGFTIDADKILQVLRLKNLKR